MDATKCRALKAELATQPEPHLIPAARFFDGNDDEGSIGCNLAKHPGIEAFRDVCEALLRRQDVQAVYVRISELDPGEGSWPFTDTLLVAGDISPEELSTAVIPLDPDDIFLAEEFGIPADFLQKYQSPVYAVWWD